MQERHLAASALPFGSGYVVPVYSIPPTLSELYCTVSIGFRFTTPVSGVSHDSTELEVKCTSRRLNLKICCLVS